MPLAKLREDYAPLPSVQPTANLDGAAAAPSPARLLQQQLELRALESSGQDLQKWSARKSLAFIVTASAALWMAIIVASAEAIHLIA